VNKTPYLDIFRADFGRTRQITREQLQQLLLKLEANAELDLAGHAGWYGVPETANGETISRAIANAPHDLTVLSLGGNIRDIQYDSPGSMNPSQYSEISFVSEGLAKGNHDAEPGSGGTMEYLRRHSARVIAVTGGPLAAPEDSERGLLNYQCDNGHRWKLPEGAPDDTRCPTCGEWWV
jgi:hypothetical protein